MVFATPCPPVITPRSFLADKGSRVKGSLCFVVLLFNYKSHVTRPVNELVSIVWPSMIMMGFGLPETLFNKLERFFVGAVPD